jgi:hypothetical protein
MNANTNSRKGSQVTPNNPNTSIPPDDIIILRTTERSPPEAIDPTLSSSLRQNFHREKTLPRSNGLRQKQHPCPIFAHKSSLRQASVTLTEPPHQPRARVTQLRQASVTLTEPPLTPERPKPEEVVAA